MKTVATSLDLDNLLIDFGSRGLSTDSLDYIESLIRSCWDKGVEVNLDPNLKESYGTYCPTENTITLGEKALSCNIQFIETLEHEFVHALQDQMAGIHNSNMEALGIPTTANAHSIVSENYNVDAHTHQLEAEAFTVEEMTTNPESQLLERCGSVKEQLAIEYTANGMSATEAAIKAELDSAIINTMLS